MTLRWRKLGRLYATDGHARHPKLQTHAANPLPVLLDGHIYRVFYSGRDSQNRSSVGAVDIDLDRREVVEEHATPAFEHGAEGSFFANGVSIGNCYEADGQRYILFMAWQVPPDGHWFGTIGRLRLGTDLTLTLDGTVPFMDLDETDPVSLSYPWVDGCDAEGFRMWYGSTERWDAGNGEMLHTIKGATSEDGHRWRRTGASVPHEIGVAQAFSRPTVISLEDGLRHMWFSYRSGTGETYRIGHAVERAGVWSLDLANAGIDVSQDGWDSEMIEYPFVFRHGDETYMLYNGNGFGRTGFGLAVLEDG